MGYLNSVLDDLPQYVDFRRHGAITHLALLGVKIANNGTLGITKDNLQKIKKRLQLAISFKIISKRRTK